MEGGKDGGMEEWVPPRAPEDEPVQASAMGLPGSTAYAPTAALSCHCLACRGGRASDHPDIHRALCKSETTWGLEPHPAGAQTLTRYQGMAAE